MKPFPALAILPLVLAAASPALTQSVKTGIEAWQSGDFGTAVSTWRTLAAKGDADAAFNLGQAYRLGKGVTVDLGAAQTLFEQAARKGHVDAATTLGVLLFQNGNQTGAMRWLKQAAEAGEPRALLLYGTALYNGDGVAPDPVLAYAYVSRAAAQGLPPARASLADLDEALPLTQRRKGLALAQAAVSAPKPPAKPKTAASRPEVKVAAPSQSVPPTAVMPGKWRVQLGAFSKRSSAEALFARLRGGALAGTQAYFVPAGAVIRLQAGPFANRAAAAAACAKVGQACFPVEAK